MADKEQSKRNPAIIAEYERRAKKLRFGASGDLIKAIWNEFGDSKNLHLEYHWRKGDALNAFYDSYRALCGRPANNCETINEFFCSKLISALQSFFGKEETSRIREECALVMKCPYSHSNYRPSYRSRRAGEYAETFFMVMVNALDFICFDMTLEQALTVKSEPFSYGSYEHLQYVINSHPSGLDNRIALELCNGNEKILALIEEAILGDNSEIQISNILISGIVKSDNKRALELLGKLLLAAKGQEGLRQSILETCDSGTLDSHIYFIRMILENDLCRFSSVVRAFDTWSGLGFGDQKQKIVEKCISLALKYLSDEKAIDAGLDSSDTPEIYLALWALCCCDIYRATESACRLLSSPEKYKRLVGWYFITHTNGDSYRHNIAVKYLDIRDPEELAWVCTNLHINREAYFSGYHWDKDNERSAKTKTYSDDTYPTDKAGRILLFNQLADIAEFIGKKNTKFAESVFPWFTQELNASAPCGVMLGLAAYDRSVDLTRQITNFIPIMNVDQRLSYYSLLLNPEIPEQRAFLLEGLSDKSQTVRERVVNRLQYYPLNRADIERLTETLITQNADLRKGIITLFDKQKESLIRPAIDSLLSFQNKKQLIAGVELLDVFSKKNPSLQTEYKEKISTLTTSETVSQDVSILLEKVAPNNQKKEGYNEENGYGLYDPATEAFDCAVYAAKRPSVSFISDDELKSLIVPDEKEVLMLYGRIADVFNKYRDCEYEAENWDGTREKVLLNNNQHRIYPLAGSTQLGDGRDYKITDYPLAEEWLAAAGEFATDKTKLVSLLSLWNIGYRYNKVYKKWFRDLFAGYPIDENEHKFEKKITEHYKNSRVDVFKVTQILEAILNTGELNLFDFVFSAYVNLVRKVPENQLGMEYEEDNKKAQHHYYSPYPVPNGGVLSADYLNYWRDLAHRYTKTDAQFASYFNEMWYEYLAADKQSFYGLNHKHIFRANQMGLISDDAVYLYFTAGVDAPEHMRIITGPYNGGRELLMKYPIANELLEKAIDRIVTLEENRGELPTALSNVASQINHFDGGAQHFVNLLAALGDTGFHRGYTYYYSGRGELTKKEGLSQLLRCCQPKSGDTPEILNQALKMAKISEKRIIQAAVYAPQWAELLEKAMDINGLKCGVWFFHAHINENFTAGKETEVAIFSAITPQQFNDGTFDKDWFYDAYHALGEKRFSELYKNAKYITNSGSTHRRSQLYADAVLGKLGKDETKTEIINKRNQEKLRAFSLIPLDEQNKNDALERYELIQKFKKESRQFGSLRQASEGKACVIALENLAITTGYGNADRMTWALEGAKIEQLRPLMEPHAIGDTEVWLNITDDGMPELNARKNGKPLKTLPKELAKDVYVAELKEAIKQLRDQKRRAKLSFEMAMVSRAGFSIAEITGLLNHPVLQGMISVLVFVTGDKLGFPTLSKNSLVLIDTSGKSQTLNKDDILIIAHPHDLITQKCWSKYQQYLYHNKIIQPFKQVFREYYPVTEDERNAGNVSRRYAGNQVQPKKTMALLKTCGWTSDYEEGLQRVWHKENLIARMYALADWFSPADIEAPTLETIQFFSRDKYELVSFADIPPVIFSETMRDIDLAVSVAHAGGVDPEASQSTVEMRIAIARELLSMLSVNNVNFLTAHAQIKGSLGEYSVHMGSGVIHKSGTGMIAVLPVHSQARGRIFIPFADDDPKTAEILSKILLFADDKKIKDPSILGQIK
ncbi:DUF4132 domain-containing protein [Lachnoclostridium sp.]|nr:DUF4132 domain-containing protein [Lachnoclostridium sp.]